MMGSMYGCIGTFSCLLGGGRHEFYHLFVFFVLLISHSSHFLVYSRFNKPRFLLTTFLTSKPFVLLTLHVSSMCEGESSFLIFTFTYYPVIFWHPGCLGGGKARGR
jgi:hypothetical protein